MHRISIIRKRFPTTWRRDISELDATERISYAEYPTSRTARRINGGRDKCARLNQIMELGFERFRFKEASNLRE